MFFNLFICFLKKYYTPLIALNIMIKFSVRDFKANFTRFELNNLFNTYKIIFLDFPQNSLPRSKQLEFFYPQNLDTF